MPRWLRDRAPYLALALGTIALGLAVALYLLTHQEEEAAFTGEGEAAPAVSVLAPGSATVEGIINATGTVAARREMPVGVVGEGGCSPLGGGVGCSVAGLALSMAQL